jgi:hypothetical protein
MIAINLPTAPEARSIIDLSKREAHRGSTSLWLNRYRKMKHGNRGVKKYKQP